MTTTTDEVRAAAERLRNLNPYSGDDSLNFVRSAKDAIQVAEAYLAGQSQPVNEQLLEASEWMINLLDDPCPYDAVTTRTVFRQRIAAAKAEQAERRLPVDKPWLRSICERPGETYFDFAIDGNEDAHDAYWESWLRIHQPENGECVVDVFSQDEEGRRGVGLTKSWCKTRGEVLDLLAVLGTKKETT